MYIIFLKIIEIIGLVAFGMIMNVAIDIMELPNVIIPYAKASSVIGTAIMIGCSITT